jgi:hypothetical protein
MGEQEEGAETAGLGATGGAAAAAEGAAMTYEVIAQWNEAGRIGTQDVFIGTIEGDSVTDALENFSVQLYAIDEPHVGDGEMKSYELKFDGVKARN